MYLSLRRAPLCSCPAPFYVFCLQSRTFLTLSTLLTVDPPCICSFRVFSDVPSFFFFFYICFSKTVTIHSAVSFLDELMVLINYNTRDWHLYAVCCLSVAGEWTLAVGVCMVGVRLSDVCVCLCVLFAAWRLDIGLPLAFSVVRQNVCVLRVYVFVFFCVYYCCTMTCKRCRSFVALPPPEV